jgi:16S rRNA (uracil1498-N3)-methyltransferase
MPVYFIQSQSIRDDQIILTAELAHHLGAVLRYQIGEIIELVDEERVRYRASLDSIAEERITAKILDRAAPDSQPIPAVTLVQSLLKHDKMDWVIQKATELGVSAILPVVTERTITRPRVDREVRQRERWQKIAKEAAQQSGRSDIPEIKPAAELEEIFRNPPGASLKILPWEAEDGLSLKSALHHLKDEASIAVLIGPEGGFSMREIEKARKAGWVSVSLGSRILRAETAGLATLAVLQYELGGMR